MDILLVAGIIGGLFGIIGFLIGGIACLGAEDNEGAFLDVVVVSVVATLLMTVLAAAALSVMALMIASPVA